MRGYSTPSHFILSNGKLLITPNHAYIGPNKIDLTADTKYVHPTTKQCNYSYTHPSKIQCSAASEISSLKSSVSSGKAQIASAITGKGISTSSTASFSTMASNIRTLPTMTAIEKAWCDTMDDYFWIPEIGMCWRDITLTISPDPYINGIRFTSANLQADASVINGPYTRLVISNGNYYEFCTIELEPPTDIGRDFLSSTMTITVGTGGYNSYFATRSVSTSFNNTTKELSYVFYVTKYNGQNTGNSNRATLTIGFAGLSVPVSYWTRVPQPGNDEYKIGGMSGNMNDYNFTSVIGY